MPVQVTARGAYMEEFSYSDSNGDGVMICNAWKPDTTSVTFTWKNPSGEVLVAKADEVMGRVKLFRATFHSNTNSFDVLLVSQD